MPRGVANRHIVVGPDFDPKTDQLRDKKGVLVTEETLSQALTDIDTGFERRRAGRPALGAPGTRAPALAVRLPTELKDELDERAKEEGRRPSELVRDAVTQYLQPARRRGAIRAR